MHLFLDDPAQAVPTALRGLEAAHPGLVRVDHRQRVVYRREPARGKVSLVSGGGAGHEPLHSGYVGVGMLDAACVGELFTAPVPDQVVAASTGTDTGAGVLHVVKNYAGDVLAFELAAEAVADRGGPAVEAVVVADDVSLPAEDGGGPGVGRRGTGLTVLVERLMGAAAEEGRGLADCAALGRALCAEGGSMAVAVPGATSAAADAPARADGGIEVGVGIHGEPGTRRGPVLPARDLADLLVGAVRTDLGLVRGDAVILLLSGLGGTPLLHLQALYAEVLGRLAAAGVAVARGLVGDYVTSLASPGCSLTLLRADVERVRLWDTPVATPALRWGV